MLSKKKQKHKSPTAKHTSSFIDEWRVVLEASNWAFENIPEVFLAFNKLAETATKAIKIDEKADVKAFHEEVNIKLRMHNTIVQGLKFGCSLRNIDYHEYRVKNTIDYIWQTNRELQPIDMKMRTDLEHDLCYADLKTDTPETISIDPKTLDWYVPYPRFTDDMFGFIYVKPCLRYINNIEGISKAIAKSAERYIKPHIFVNAPESASNSERNEVFNAIEDAEDVPNIVFPSGFSAVVEGTKNFFDGVSVINMITQKIITGLGLPKLIFNIPDGSNRATAKNSMDVLYDKIQSMAEILVLDLNKCYKELYSYKPFTLKRLSSLDVEQLAKAKMLNCQSLSMLATAISQEGLDEKVKKKLEGLILAYEELET